MNLLLDCRRIALIGRSFVREKKKNFDWYMPIEFKDLDWYMPIEFRDFDWCMPIEICPARICTRRTCPLFAPVVSV